MCMNNGRKDGIIKGAFSLGVGAFICKILGAFYRIPLTNLLGSYGLGLYQMVFPVYALLLDFSGAGLPSALSRIIAMQENKDIASKRLLKSSIKLFLTLGIFACIFMALFSKTISILQGNESASVAYLFLSPAIAFVSVISCFRGYFQAYLDMRPTAISQIIEQVVNAIVSVWAAYVLFQRGKNIGEVLGDPESYAAAYGAAGGTLGTNIGSVFGLGFMLFVFYAFMKSFKK